MNSFNDILVYAEIDDADCLTQVVELAKAHSASITICEVVPAAPQGQDSQGIVERIAKLRWTQAFRRLRRICDHFAEHTVIDYSVLTGVPFVAITEQVVQQNFDLVVHISAPLSADVSQGLNATGMHLMRKCPCAIWALHPQTTSAKTRPVLLAVDREPGDERGKAEAFVMGLAEKALAVAAARKSELILVHAWQPFGVELLDSEELALSSKEREDYWEDQHSQCRQWFKRLAQSVQSLAPEGVTVRAQLLEGDPVTVTSRQLTKNEAGLLVLGTVGTSANPGVLIGGTTESILASSGASVIALKPPGFVSPLAIPSA